jgi:Myb-like DNA-binding domain
MMTSVIDGGDTYIGPWSLEEVEELTAIVRSMMAKQGGTIAGISWADVAIRMGHKRNGQQCRNKWCDYAALLFIELRRIKK